MKERFSSFTELSKNKIEGMNYSVVTKEVTTSKIAIIVIHGGKIEPDVDKIAEEIAGDDYNLYIFKGSERENNFYELHVTSNNFDDPRCINIVSKCDIVISLHGFIDEVPIALMGGLDVNLRETLKANLEKHGIKTNTDNHPFKGEGLTNPCNLGTSGKGAQIEFSKAIRDSTKLRHTCATAIREVLENLK